MTGILNPELVADLRMVLDNFGRHSITSDMTIAAERLNRALFPATEPAEEVEEWSAIEDVPVGLIVKGQAMIWKWDGTHPYRRNGGGWTRESCDYANRWWPFTPAPAEPAEEETKAETRPPLLTPNQIRAANPGKHETFIFGQQRADGTACVGCSWQTYEVLDTIRAVAEHDDAKGLVHDHAVWITKNGICPCGQPASSPVVPAPTETGPWQRIEDVPDGVCVKSAKLPYPHRWPGGVHRDAPADYIEAVNKHYAPFVASEEG